MNKIKKFLIKVGVIKAKPHEKAELGQGTYGRQPEPGNAVSAAAKLKGTMKIRVWRAANQLNQRKGANDKQIAEYQAIIDLLKADNAVIASQVAALETDIPKPMFIEP